MTTFGSKDEAFLFFSQRLSEKKHAAALEAFFSGHFIRTSIFVMQRIHQPNRLLRKADKGEKI